MKNINNKSKRRVIVAGGILISLALIAMIGARFTKAPVKEANVKTQSTEISDVVIEDPISIENLEEKEVKVKPIEIPKDTQNNGADDKGTEQKIQGDVPGKPTYTKEQLTDPTKKPDGEKVNVTKKEDIKSKPAEQPKPQKQESTSSILPGFDTVREGGEGEVTYAGSDGDINKQVGTMD